MLFVNDFVKSDPRIFEALKIADMDVNYRCGE